MLVLTILSVAFVHPVRAVDVTGATALTLSDRLLAPSAPYEASWCTVTLKPAAYGLAALSRGSVVAAWWQGDLCAGLEGMAGGGWTDLSLITTLRIPFTTAFSFGFRGSAMRRGADGFAPVVGGALSPHVRIILDPTWSVVCSVDDLLQFHTRFQPPSGTLRLGAAWEGAVTASAVISVSAVSAPDLQMSAVASVRPELDLRARIGTAPLRVAAAVRLAVASLPGVTADVEWVGPLGVRSTWAIDFY